MPKESAMVIALKSRKKPENLEMEEPRQMVRVGYTEIPSLKEKKPGDPVTIYLYGSVDSSSMDGAMVKIDKFTEKAEEKVEEKTEDKPIMVRNQIQPYPGGF